MIKSLTHYAVDELVRSSRHYQRLVNDKGNSAEVIACEGAAFGEEALAAEALRTMHSLSAMNRPRWTSTACKSRRTTSTRA